MRTPLFAVLFVAGCFDLNALDYGTLGGVDQGAGGSKDLAGQGAPSDLASLDLTQPVYWVNVFKGGPGAKALRAVGGASGLLVAVGDTGTALTSANGSSWNSVSSNPATNFTGVWASAANDAWVVGKDGGKLFHYDGNALTQAAMFPPIAYAAVAGASATQVIAVGDDPNMAGQWNKMTKWQPLNDGLGQKQHGMWGMGNRVWSVGENTVGGYYDVNGQAFTKVQIDASAGNITFTAIWGSQETDVWAAGATGNLSHSANGSFQMVSSGTTANLNGIWGLTATDIWAVGDGGTILHYDGARWQAYTKARDVQNTESLQAIWGNGSNLWTVSDQGNIYRYL